MVANRRHSQPKKAKPSKLPLQTSPKATDEHDLESNKSNSEELSDALLQRQLQSTVSEPKHYTSTIIQRVHPSQITIFSSAIVFFLHMGSSPDHGFLS
ncbi:hypothetical protein Y032_0020g175 [Ancylostoma ceylanicum]|nr:hypothetical protein Y032_0020g175 [Ancylostoma ceylanicum]